MSSERWAADPEPHTFPQWPRQRGKQNFWHIYISITVCAKSQIFSLHVPNVGKAEKWANPNSSHVCSAGRRIRRSQRWQTMQISEPGREQRDASEREGQAALCRVIMSIGYGQVRCLSLSFFQRYSATRRPPPDHLIIFSSEINRTVGEMRIKLKYVCQPLNLWGHSSLWLSK